MFIQDSAEHKIRNRTEQAAEALCTGFTYPAVDIEEEIQTVHDEKGTKKAAFAEKIRSRND